MCALLVDAPVAERLSERHIFWRRCEFRFRVWLGARLRRVCFRSVKLRAGFVRVLRQRLK